MQGFFLLLNCRGRSITVCKQIGDFGMARDLEESEYYIMSKKGPLPLKWTAPEVNIKLGDILSVINFYCRHLTLESTPLSVIVTVMEWYCMRFGL